LDEQQVVHNFITMTDYANKNLRHHHQQHFSRSLYHPRPHLKRGAFFVVLGSAMVTAGLCIIWIPFVNVVGTVPLMTVGSAFIAGGAVDVDRKKKELWWRRQRHEQDLATANQTNMQPIQQQGNQRMGYGSYQSYDDQSRLRGQDVGPATLLYDERERRYGFNKGNRDNTYEYEKREFVGGDRGEMRRLERSGSDSSASGKAHKKHHGLIKKHHGKHHRHSHSRSRDAGRNEVTERDVQVMERTKPQDF